MKKRKYPENVEYADMNKSESKRKYTKEYIEERIRNQERLSKKEIEELSPELKLYYNQLDAVINEFNDKK